MRTATESLLGASEFNRSPGNALKRAESGERIVILRHNKPAAMIIDVETAERVSRLEELEEDMKLLVASMVRVATDSGRRYALDDVIAELDIYIDSSEAE